MKRRLPILIAPIIVVVVVVIGVLHSPSTSSTAGAAPIVGHHAPAIALQAVDGGRVTLDSLRGKTVLVDFFATWCIPCRKEMPEINQLARAFPSKVTVLAVDKQEPASDVVAFSRHLGLRFTPLLDPDLVVWQRYRVQVQPVSFWIDPSGTIRAVHYGAMSKAFMQAELRALA